MKVAILCAARKSVYHSIPDVEVYDIDQDASTFVGGMPIVSHPPCRAWSTHVRHQAKPEAGEQELGLWCCEMLRQCGGVLEQPGHSHLFAAAGLPGPGSSDGNLWTIEVWQAWWGYPMKKKTWLCFCGIDPDQIVLPFRLHAGGSDRRREQCMSKNQRSATTLPFAEWLVAAARGAKVKSTLYGGTK